jgi:hypothetical protein
MRDRGVLTRLLDDGGCACPTMPLSERCAASQSVATTVSLELGEEVVLASFLSGNRSLDHSAMTESRHLFK